MAAGHTMVGDMFNNGLKSKLDAVCSELARYAAETSSKGQGSKRRPNTEVHQPRRIGWVKDLPRVAQ